nr:hypothetical protein [uncultured Amphritea sp.]
MILMLPLAFQVPESLVFEDRSSLQPSIIVANFTALLKHRVYIGYTLCCSFIFASLFAFLSDAPFVLVDYFKVPAQYCWRLPAKHTR